MTDVLAQGWQLVQQTLDCGVILKNLTLDFKLYILNICEF
jgi:hypothetical protein